MSAFRSKLLNIEAQKLRIHPTAQRVIVPSNLKRIADELDLDAIGIIHAVEYEIDGDAAIWVVDGQHRIRTLLDLGLGEWVVKVVVHVDVKDDARASELFLRLQSRAAVCTFDKFENEIRAKNRSSVGALAVAGHHGFKLARAQADGVITCVSSLKKLYDADEGISLHKTLDAIVAAWGHQASAVEGRLIEGLGLCFRTYNGQIDAPSLVKKLAKYPGGASALLGDAKGLTRLRKIALGRAVGECIVSLYNSGKSAKKLDPL